MSELDRVHDVAQRLRDAGYAPVQEASRLPGTTAQVDVLGWAPNSADELVPWVAVEVKKTGSPDVALPQLSRIRDTLGTVEHYVVVNDNWFRTGPSVRDTEAVDGPGTPENAGRGVVVDEGLATSLIQDRVRIPARGASSARSELESFVASAATSAADGIALVGDSTVVPVEPTVLWRARRSALADLADRDPIAGQLASPPAVATAIAELLGDRLGGDVVDPFCGAGAFIWSVADRAIREGRQVTIQARDISNEIVGVAAMIGSTAPVEVAIAQADSFRDTVPLADVVVSAPPFGLRLAEPYELVDGTSTKSGDLASIDVAIRALRPGGRAVLQLPPGFTFRGGADQRYRDYLASNVRVAALIGCPAGSAFGTSIPTVLLVIDKRSPSETFVAQLGEDWEVQLAPEGPALCAALAHIDHRASHD